MDWKNRIRQNLSVLQPRRVLAGYTREAAVLIPIFEREGEPVFLLTKRTETVETHKGQISFPGGMRCGQENLRETALRETLEEIGIAPGQIEIAGQFHDYLSSTEYRVTPFAGFLPDSFSILPQPQEVAVILEVPFSLFTDPSRLRIEKMRRGKGTIDVYFYAYRSHQIWGLTARIIRDFLLELNWSA